MVKMPKNQIPEGTVVLIDKPSDPVAVSQTMAYKSLPKKPLSDKQKANLERLIEKNRVRWKTKQEERREEMQQAIPETVPEDATVVPKRKNKRIEALKDAPVPTEIPDGKMLAIVKPKRKYTKKPKTIEFAVQSEDAPIGNDNEVCYPESPESSPPQRKRPPRTKASVPQAPRKYYYSETSETSAVSGSDTESDTESDSEDDYPVQKYVAKTKKRMESLSEINERLRMLSLRRSMTSHSVF
jgi:hypothetical protein